MGQRPVFAALCFLAALFTKPTFVAAPLASLLYLALERRWAMARRLAATLLLGGLSALALLAALTHGWALFHMFLAFPDPYSLRLYAVRIAPFFIRNLPLVAGAVPLAVAAGRLRQPSLPLLYAALATVTTLTAGKWGSDANHFLEWQAALALAAGIGYAEFRFHAGAESAVALVPLMMAVVIGFGLVNPAGLPLCCAIAARSMVWQGKHLESCFRRTLVPRSFPERPSGCPTPSSSAPCPQPAG